MLGRYFERLDGDCPETVRELLAPDFSFATLWGEDSSARLTAGGQLELQAYFASRDARGQRHHVLQLSAHPGGVELAAGYTTRYGIPVASFLITVHVDDRGLIRRILAARTTALSLLG